MHNIISVIIVIMILLILVKAIGKRKTRKQLSSKQQNPLYNHSDNPTYDLGCGNGSRKVACSDDLHASVMGLHEVEQNTRSRGYIPHANQPNHVANLWKCDQSQCNQEDMSDRNEYNSDITPVRNPVVQMDSNGSSNMHITSRFATIPSSN
ncbi:MAG: hypothetical protein ACRCZI_13165 [Cetobacterium sp.]